MKDIKKHKKRAMSSYKAREVRAVGHMKAKIFSEIIHATNYDNGPQDKKDVIDKNGDAHSVKSGRWWQIFLYSQNRLANDPSFKVMNGIGVILSNILNIFPDDRNVYISNKQKYKKRLMPLMRELKEKISDNRLEAFLHKSIFNGGEVTYLTINPPNENKFHIFHYLDVINILSANLIVDNSKARNPNQNNDQKVIFQIDGKGVGEIEVRNDSDVHYREIKFRLNAQKIINILVSNSKKSFEFSNNVILYDKAINKFISKKQHKK